MRNLMPILAAATLVLGTTPADAGIDDPPYKLLPNDGAAGDRFGNTVGIDGNTVIVGARLDDVGGFFDSGSAYLFDAATGQQLFKLLPGDGAQQDFFGKAVAISGTTAIVGSRCSAYLFDTTTGLQIGAKLLPNDGEAGDGFGGSVAISGTTAIVGAINHSHIGFSTGSAYLFDTTTGLQLFELHPIGGASFRFGSSVAISGTTAIVGAFLASINGFEFGAAYLFDTTTGLQIAMLLPSDGQFRHNFGISVGISGLPGSQVAIVGANAVFDIGSAYLFDVTTGMQLFKLVPGDGQANEFGLSVAIRNTTAIVGAHLDDDNGSNSGSAYLFDISTPTSPIQLRKLLPIDGAADDGFGRSVAIDGPPGLEVAIVGSRLDDDNGSSSGSAYLTAHDTDSDGLLDSWEIDGIPYINTVSGLDLLYVLPGADPLHKDLYVEVDSMVGLGFNLTAQANVIQAFANAPNALVNNPDGFDGITLHLLVDETTLPITPFPNKFTDFDAVKIARFGTPAERAVSDPASLLEAKARAYRYCIFGQSYGTTSSSGLAEFAGNDFMVTLGLWTTPGGTIDQQAGTFMHEFGHTLGLGHGGGDGTNCKPNYYSVMSYTWQSPNTPYADFWRLDYSHVKLATLDESALDESAGIDGSDPAFAAILTLIGTGGEPPVMLWATPDGTPMDWNLNGTIDAGTVALDMNYHFQCDNPRVPCPSPGEILVGHADWPNLRYGMFGSSFADGVHDVTTDDTEMTLEIFEQMDATPQPPALCLADTNGDSMVNVTDLLTLLGGWGPNPGHAGDINGDGNVNVTDLLALLAAWGVCP